MADYVTDPVKQIVGYRGTELTAEQLADGKAAGDVILVSIQDSRPRKHTKMLPTAKEYRVNKAKHYGIIKRNIKEGSHLSFQSYFQLSASFSSFHLFIVHRSSFILYIRIQPCRLHAIRMHSEFRMHSSFNIQIFAQAVHRSLIARPWLAVSISSSRFDFSLFLV